MSKPNLRLYQSSITQEIKVVLGLIALLLAFRTEALSAITFAYLGGAHADAGLYIWLTKSNARDLLSLPWFNTSAFFPYTRTLAWSDNFILPSLIVSFLVQIGFSHVVAYNCLLLFVQFLNGYCTYRLAFRLSGNMFPSFFAGVSFMLGSYLTAQMGHPQLQFAFWLPLGLLVLFKSFTSQKVNNPVLFGLCITGAFLTTVYYALFLSLLFPLTVAALQILRPKLLTRKNYVALGCGCLIGLIPILFFILPYLDIKDIFGSREQYESYAFASSALSWLSTPSQSLLYGFTSSWSHAEAQLFQGFVFLLLGVLAFGRLCEAKKLKRLGLWFIVLFLITLVGSERSSLQGILPDSRLDIQIAHILATLAAWLTLFFLARLLRKLGQLEQKLGFETITNRAIIAIFIFLGVTFAIISLGPLANPTKGDLSFSPFTVLYYVVPGFDSMRAISRAGIISILCLSVCSAFILPLLRLYNRSAAVTGSLLIALFVAENAQKYYPLEPLAPTPEIIQELQLQNLTKNDVVIHLPMTDELKNNGTVKSWRNFSVNNVNYMLQSLMAGGVTVNGYSGQRSSVMVNFPRKLSGFPDQRSLHTLELLPSMKYIVFHGGAERKKLNAVLRGAEQFSDELKTVASSSDGGILFEFTPRTPLSEQFFLRVPSYPGGFLELELEANYASGEPEITVSLLEQDHFEGNPIATLPVPANGKSDTYTVRLPGAVKRALPYRITFRTEDKHRVTLLARKYSLP